MEGTPILLISPEIRTGDKRKRTQVTLVKRGEHGFQFYFSQTLCNVPNANAYSYAITTLIHSSTAFYSYKITLTCSLWVLSFDNALKRTIAVKLNCAVLRYGQFLSA